MKLRIPVAAASMLMSAALLTACVGQSTASQDEGTITIALNGPIDTWNPQEALTTQSFAVYPQVFASLLSTSPDGSAIEPGLAESYEFDDTAKTITFHLDPAATFSNGDPVTSADVAYSEGLWAAGELYGSYFSSIASVDAPDEQTVVFTLTAPDHALLGILATANAAVVPEDLGGVDAATFWKKPVSAGAYRIASEDVGQSITLERNEHFAGDGSDLPQIVEYVMVADAAQQLLQFQSGKVDVVNDVQLDSAGQYDPSRLQSTTSAGVVVLMLNTQVAPLDDPQLRRAINLAIDHEALLAGGFADLAVAATSVLPQVVPGVAACEECDWPTTDVAAATELVEASGYDGQTITMTVPSEVGPEKLAAQALVPMLAEAGIDVELAAVPESAFIEKLENGDYSVAPIVYNALAPSAVDPLGFLAATGILFTGSDPTAANDAIAALTAATDEQATQAATAGFEAWAFEHTPLVPLGVPDVIYAVSERVEGFVPNPYKAWYVEDVTLTR
ncbi:ABC transporter substrate-binding protein [Agromyces neolithicus]|uniref:Solute-binding protein family 5 domain-containing protein n=1 Tax=Agromyces neolithicus TaxID=269420 RepID=A0ABN2M517_9MICO